MIESSKYEEWLKTGKRMKSPWSPEVIGDQEMVGHDCPTYHEKVVTKVTRGVRTHSEGGVGVEPGHRGIRTRDPTYIGEIGSNPHFEGLYPSYGQ